MAMNYDEWEASVPDSLRADPLWHVTAYRLATFSCDIGWRDATKLAGDKRTGDLSSQLYRALGSIGANLAEGYSRGSGKDRARFYEYALGSARESRDWYYKSRHLLGDTVVEHRLRYLTSIVQLLLTMIPDQRTKSLHDASQPYSTTNLSSNPMTDADLLNDIPFPE